MILEIIGILALFGGIFVLLSIYRFITDFYKDSRLSIYRIKLSRHITGYFILLLSANFLLVILYALASGPKNIKYGVLGITIYTIIFGIFFLHLSRVIEGKPLLKL